MSLDAVALRDWLVAFAEDEKATTRKITEVVLTRK